MAVAVAALQPIRQRHRLFLRLLLPAGFDRRRRFFGGVLVGSLLGEAKRLQLGHLFPYGASLGLVIGPRLLAVLGLLRQPLHALFLVCLSIVAQKPAPIGRRLRRRHGMAAACRWQS